MICAGGQRDDQSCAVYSIMSIDPETWELARLLLERRPETALEVALERAQEAHQQGEEVSYRTWLLIADTIREVIRAPTPEDPLN